MALMSQFRYWADAVSHLTAAEISIPADTAAELSTILRAVSVFLGGGRVIQPERFLGFMEALGLQQVTNPHDRIYAVMGLAPWLQLKVDYDAPLGKVFEEATLQIMWASKRFDFIQYAGIRSSNSLRLPSWAIDFVAIQGARRIPTAAEFSADGRKNFAPTALIPGTWKARILICDRVVAFEVVSPFSQREMSRLSEANTTIVKRLASVQQALRHKYLPSADRATIPFTQSFWRTLHFGNYMSDDLSQLIEWPEDCAELTSDLENWLHKGRRLGRGHSPYSAGSLAITASGATMIVTARRRLAITKGHGVQTGDVVAVIAGSWFPVVLRANTVDGISGYQVVGPCYVDGKSGLCSLQFTISYRYPAD